MADETAEMREKLARYRYLLTMITDAAVRKVLRDDIVELERRLAEPGEKLPEP